LSSWPKATKPWSRIHIDYAGPVDGYYYLAVVDAYSKWPEVVQTKFITTSSTINNLDDMFSRWGVPETIVSDNGTQFSSKSFHSYCSRLGIQHKFSPPYHPQSNGQAERFVDTFKRSLLKMKNEAPSLHCLRKFFITYRRTPSSILDNKSPAEKFLNRRLRTELHQISPKTDRSETKDTVMEEQFNAQHGAKHRFFKTNDLVWVRDYRSNHTSWIAGVVLKRRGKTTYSVKVENVTWIRHTNQIRRREEAGQITTDVLLETFDLTVPDFPEQLSNSAPPDESTVNLEQEIDHHCQENQHDPELVDNIILPSSPTVLRRSNRPRRTPDRYHS
jgi:hypothetical protein